MPKNLDAAIRYRVIDRCLRSKGHAFPSKDYLREQCAEVIGVNDISVRTLEKDLYEMRNNEALGYFAPIKFDTYKKGYYYEDASYSIDKMPISEDDMLAIQMASQVLEQYKHIDLFAGFKPVVEKLTESLSIRNKVNTKSAAFNFVHFEDKPYVSGGTFLQDILNAILENKKIEITYSKFFQEGDTKYIFDAHVLKEYQGIWYVSGWLDAAQEIRTFALDRIKKLEVLQLEFKRRNDFKHEQYFREVIGVSHPNNQKTVSIVLKAKNSLVPYLKLLPLHVSQKFLEETDEESTLKVDVIPNKEFFMKILSFGDQIKVSEPELVVSELEATLKKMSALYR